MYLSSNGDYLSRQARSEPESVERGPRRAPRADRRQGRASSAYRDRATEETPADAAVAAIPIAAVTYTLTDGRVVRRSYDDCRAFTAAELGEPGSVAQTATALLNCPEAARSTARSASWRTTAPTPSTGGYYDVVSDGAYGEDDGELTAAQANTLVSALRRDYEAGRAVQRLAL